MVSDAVEAGQTIYVTYTKTNPETGEVYSGRASGKGTPDNVLKKRDSNHHKGDSFGPAQLDRVSTDKQAIRGREQQLIDTFGKAKSVGGTSGNAINGISDRNKNKSTFLRKAIKLLGDLAGGGGN